MGYGAFLIMEVVILLVYKLERSQQHMRGLVERNGLEFGTYYSSLTITFTIMLLSMFLLGSIYFALVAGDIVAKENEDGNLRMVFARPITRLRLLLVKYTAICLYTFSFVFFVGVSGYAMAVWAVGWEGGLFVMEPKMKVFAAYPEWSECATRLALSAAGIGISMITLSSIAFMFSCFRIKPAAAAIITLTILFVDMNLQNFPFFKPYESEHLEAYRVSTLANHARNKTEAVCAAIAPPVPQAGDEPVVTENDVTPLLELFST
jgi:ABC-2 type transport system permease protein